MTAISFRRSCIAGVALAVLTITAPVAAQQNPAPPLPDPGALSAGWWDYFEAEGDALATQAQNFEKRLNEVEAGWSAQGSAPFPAGKVLIDEIRQLLERYVRLKGEHIPDPPASGKIRDEYSITELQQLAGNRREVQLELELQQDDITRQQEALKTALGAVNDHKAAYLALPASSPERLPMGLTLIRDRFEVATGQQVHRLRKARIQNQQAAATRLDNELAAARERLVADAADVQKFQSQAQSLTAELDQLRKQAAQVRLQTKALAETALDQAQSRLQYQTLIDYEVKIASAEIGVAQAKLATALAAYLLNSDATAVETLRSELKEGGTQIRQVSVEMDRWRRATNKERVAASSQLSLLEAGNESIGKIHGARLEQADATSLALSRLEEEHDQTELLVGISEDRVIEGGGRFADYWNKTRDSTIDALKTLKLWSTASLFELNETPVTMLGLLRVILILVVAWWISKIARGALAKVMQRRETMSKSSVYTLSRLSHYAILTIGFFVALSSIGLDFTKFALIASALGVGIGFGLQAIFSNFVAGLIILFEKSLKVGDFVELESGVHGLVQEISIRATLVTTNDNIDILVPNSEFVNGRVINWTLREAYRRVRIPFGVAYGTDKDLVRKAVLEAADQVPYTLKSIESRKPQVWLVQFGDSSLNFELVVWLTPEAVMRPATVSAAYTWEIESALAKYGIEIPFPQRDINIRSFFGEKDEAGLEWMEGKRDRAAFGDGQAKQNPSSG
ncbi:MAG: mechanosensitive ion channel [Gammaproteobacteria bacterium]|nr:mechanosensitive ion channel [Gammaproteobacteria bacterium]MDH3412324.1 mechanosensitive ion channel [Gammaproteobacteria bacterium]